MPTVLTDKSLRQSRKPLLECTRTNQAAATRILTEKKNRRRRGTPRGVRGGAFKTRKAPYAPAVLKAPDSKATDKSVRFKSKAIIYQPVASTDDALSGIVGAVVAAGFGCKDEIKRATFEFEAQLPCSLPKGNNSAVDCTDCTELVGPGEMKKLILAESLVTAGQATALLAAMHPAKVTHHVAEYIVPLIMDYVDPQTYTEIYERLLPNSNK